MSKRSSNRLGYAVNRAALAGSKSHQHRVRQNARNFVSTLQEAGWWVEKWTNVTNKHFQKVADTMKEKGISDGRIAEVFSAARHVCETYGNERISDRNADFGVRRGSITNAESKAVDPEKIEQVIYDLEHNDQYEHAPRCATQFRLQYELGLRKEESAKVDLVNDWNRENHSVVIQYGTKGGRPRVLEHCQKDKSRH